jgi:hypothetical protein
VEVLRLDPANLGVRRTLLKTCLEATKRISEVGFELYGEK